MAIRVGDGGLNLRGGGDPSPLLGLFAVVGYPGRGLTVVWSTALVLPRVSLMQYRDGCRLGRDGG